MGKQVQFAGLLVWREDTAGTGNFLFHDKLGSPRVTGSASGGLEDDNDYLPFGGVVSNYGSSPSDNLTLFTGYESDRVQDNTDYAVNRNLSTSMMRFNRPDPYDGSYDPSNPQSLNRYSYVLNRPLTYTDRSGLECTTTNYYVDGNWDSSETNCSVSAEPDEPISIDGGGGGGWWGGFSPEQPTDPGGSGYNIPSMPAPNNGKCLPNVNNFITAHLGDAQTLQAASVMESRQRKFSQ